MSKETKKVELKEEKKEEKVVKSDKFDAFWANYKSQYPEKAKLAEENDEIEKIKVDFQKSLIN